MDNKELITELECLGYKWRPRLERWTHKNLAPIWYDTDDDSIGCVDTNNEYNIWNIPSFCVSKNSLYILIGKVAR